MNIDTVASRMVITLAVIHVALSKTGKRLAVTLKQDGAQAPERLTVLLPADAEPPATGTRIVNPTLRRATFQSGSADWKADAHGHIYLAVDLLDADAVEAPDVGADAQRAAAVFARAKPTFETEG
jgi:hypothetical protein